MNDDRSVPGESEAGIASILRGDVEQGFELYRQSFGRRIWASAGLLVLMPSFYTHWTVPLAPAGLRTSIAFDVIRDEVS